MAVKLYRNYTVVVQDSLSFEPNNDLRLFLYEGKLELKVDPLSGQQAVFQYGTTVLAQAAKTEYGVAATAVVADADVRPGEYDFVGLDLDATASGYAGETLYSVVACPARGYTFDSALIIVENTDISDPNLKQMVRFAVGSTGSIGDNLAFAGGTVVFQQYTIGVTNNESTQYLKLIGLPDVITNLIESPLAAPLEYAVSPYQKLIPRFNVYYADENLGVYSCIVWQGVPAYKTADESWVIRLQADEYNTRRTKEFGILPAEFQLNAIYASFTVSVDVRALNIHVRNFSETPATTIPTVDAKAEKVCVHSFVDVGGNRIVGIGDWSYAGASETPSRNLDVKGALGMRVRIAGTTIVDFGPTVQKFGFDTTQTYFGVGATAAALYINGTAKISAAISSVLLGANSLSYPRLNMSTASGVLEGSASTRLSVSSTSVLGTIASETVLDLTQNVQKLGYDLDGVSPVYFGTAATALTAKFQSYFKLYVTAISTKVAFDTTAYPRLEMTTGSVKIPVSATSYADFITGVSGTAKIVMAGQEVLLAEESPSSKVSIGYYVGTRYWMAMQSTGIDINYSLAIGLMTLNTTNILISTDLGTATKPRAIISETDAYVRGTSNTYLRVTSSNQLYAHVLSGSPTTSKRALSLDGTDARFGYYVDDSTGVYFKATSAQAEIVRNGLTTFQSSSGEVSVGVNCSNWPKIVATNSDIAIRYASNSGLVVGASITGTISGSDRLLLTSSGSKIHYEGNAKVEVLQYTIELKPDVARSASSSVYVGIDHDCAYFRVPLLTQTQIAAQTTVPFGSLVYDITNDVFYIRKSTGWKIIATTPPNLP